MLKTCGELSLADVEADVRRHLEAKDFGPALDAIRDAVDTVINNRRSVARVYGSTRLDEACLLVAQTMQAEMPTHPTPSPSPRGTVIMATELVAAGGHIEVIKDLSRLGHLAEPVQLLLTNNFNRIDRDEQNEYAASMRLPMTAAEGATTAERLHSLIDFLQSHRPETLVLLVHNQDALGIATALLGLAAQTLYVHHGDHHLSLGVTCKVFSHLDLSNHAFFYCRHTLGMAHNRYLPLTLAKQRVRERARAFLAEGHAVTGSVGRPDKFDVPGYQYQYLDLIGLILAATGGRHVHIGNLSTQQLARLHESLAKYGIESSRFEHIAWAESVSSALIDNGVDLYLASFPYGGGKSQIEAMATGMPTLIHRNYRSRVLSGIDLGYPGVLTWGDEHELNAVLRGLTPSLLQHHASCARQHFERHHAEDRFTEAMRSAHTDEAGVNALTDVYCDGLQAFLDEEAELNGTSIQAENGRLQKLLAQRNEEIAHLHARLAHERTRRSPRRMLKAWLAGRGLKT